MDLICGLVGKFCDLVIDLSWEQLRYLIFYHRNIDQLNEQLKELTFERSSVQHQIDEAENNVEQIEEKVHHWLGQVDALSEQIQKFHEEESQAKTECNITSCPNPLLRYKLSKRAKAMTEEVGKIFEKRIVGKISYRVPLLSMVELTKIESNERIDSRVRIMNQILEELRNPSVHMIGLCGLGGVGKTTIAKEVAKNQKIFEKVIMVPVSQEMNIEKIQDWIIEKLDMQLNERTEEGKASRLYVRLKKETKMLLILDDLWKELDLGKVGIPFVDVERDGKTNEGCKILLTSRNETLLSKAMKCQTIIRVDVLLEDEAWELFRSIAELSIESSSCDLKSIASEIVQKSGRLPLAIATAAKALKGKNIDGYRDYLARLKHPLARSFTGIREVDTILKLSYEDLSRENKDIFLLSAMLSHDPSIEDLLMNSVGLDILKHTQNMGDARNAIFDIVGKLKSSNLFLDSFSSHHFTMHDVFRDVALSVASVELNAVIVRHSKLDEWPDENDLKCCKRICLQESDICDLPEELHGPLLEFFSLNSKESDLTIPNMFFKSSKKLKVLAITDVNFSSLPSLSFLQKLKALFLHSCLLEDITEIRSLRKLKVLSLAYSKIQRLPVEVAELTSLQMLNLSHCSKLEVIPQKLLSSLKKLEVLYMGNSFNQWKVEESSKVDENASLDELMDLPISSLEIHIPNLSMLPENLFLKMNLRRYRIFIGDRWTWYSNYEASKILKLEQESSIDLTARLRNLAKGVEDLHLYGSNGQENVLYNLDASGFPCLRHLRIERNDDIKYIVLNSAHHEDAFPILESLELKNLKALENLCEGPNDIVFGHLHTLKLENLPALTGDFSIKDRTTKNASNKIFKSLFNKVLLPKLEILELSYLWNRLPPLIWDDQLLHNSFNNLKTLMVNSRGFVKLVPLHVLKSLNNLEELHMEDCHMLEIVFDFEDLNDYYKEMESSSVVVPLKKLKLWNLPKLKNVWSNHYKGNVSFPSLRSVDVYKCKSLTSIFPASIAKGMLCGLEELDICCCGVDVIVTKDQVSESIAITLGFPRLTSLRLYGLPNLRNFYPQKHTLEWPHLNELSIQCCDKLEIFEKEVSSSSEIYEEENMLDSKYPLLPHDKVIRNLETLTLQGKEVEKIGSGQFLMYHFPKLKLLHLAFEKEPYFTSWERSPNLGKLKLSGDFEKALGGDNVAALMARFPQLTLTKISIMGSLSPSLVSSLILTHLNMEWCYGTTLMTSSIARSLVHLTHLSVGSCYQMEEIITKQEGENDEDKEIFFNKLKFLELDNLQELKRFCGYNYTFKFLLLEKLIIKQCSKFKTFSPGLIETPSLKSVQLEQDRKKHEIWDTDLNKTVYLRQYVTSRELVLDEDDAIMIRNDQFPADCYPQVKILRIEGFVDEWLTFPYTLLERFPKLNELHMKNSSFEEIFPSIAPSCTSFYNLTVLKVSKCYQLVYLVTCSTVKSLVNLEILAIHDCEKLKEIVRNDTDQDVEREITFNGLKTQEDKRDFNIEDRATNTRRTNIPRSLFSHNKVLVPKFGFPRLTSLRLSDLPNLRNFYPQTHTLEWPRLNHLSIKCCDELEIFEKEVSGSSEIYEEENMLDSQYPLLSHDKVIGNLETLTLQGKQVEKIGSGQFLMYHFPKLKRLHLSPEKEPYFTFWERSTKLGELKLSGDFEKALGGDNVAALMACFSQLTLENVSTIGSLSPSLISSPNLTHLNVKSCREWTTLMTSSIARNLVHLMHLSISYCDQIEEIITKQEGTNDKDKEIFFKKLEFLKLYYLPRLKRFCGYNYTFRFPLLKHVTITECPQLTMFCPGAIHAPRLQSIQVNTHIDIWMTDLNNTIQHLLTFEEVISTCKSMALNSKNITMITNVFPEVNNLYVENFTDEGVTFPYSSLERFPKVDKLYVEHCSFEEIFLSQDQIIDFMGKSSQLKGLYIAYMDKLKSILKDDSQLPPIHQNLTDLEVKSCCSLVKLAPSSASFQNLQSLSVSGCHQLIYLVTTSTAKSLVSLRWLKINDCKRMVEIVMNETNEEVQGGVTFNQLWMIKLTDMPSLKMFSSQSHTFKFPELKEIKIIGCPKMKMFCQGVLETPRLSKVKIGEHDMKWKDEGDLNKTMEGPAKGSIIM
ncbi:hypothetical protein QN277_005886 [Acacia crassicarpa]|uniref:AAA+ ATPase domain-containing protein n=1 Tax=Acacia crassicarpa TaxID=499986 RepID=A0AAE1MA74_9FABA|nr:hypothetical protein QN277_005886 [Acacia crassicarpa]